MVVSGDLTWCLVFSYTLRYFLESVFRSSMDFRAYFPRHLLHSPPLWQYVNRYIQLITDYRKQNRRPRPWPSVELHLVR